MSIILQLLFRMKGLAVLILLVLLAVSASGQTIPAVYYKLYYVTRDSMNVSRVETVSIVFAAQGGE
jgi:hypothetical protein